MKHQDFLLNGIFNIIIGSGSEQHLEPTDEDIEMCIGAMICHYFQDMDFVLNALYGEDKQVYSTLFKDKVLNPLMSDLNAFKDKWLTLGYPYVESKTEHWKLNNVQGAKEVFENFVLNTKFRDMYLEYVETW